MEIVSNQNFYNSLSLRFFHPSTDPDLITRSLDLHPKRCWKAGTQKTTPKGTPIDELNYESYWCYTINNPNKGFVLEIEKILDKLKEQRQFIKKFLKDKGRVEIFLQLPGSINIGDTISPETLKKLSDFKISLSIEVFPDMHNKILSRNS